MRCIQFMCCGLPPGLLMNSPNGMTRPDTSAKKKVIPSPEEEAEAKCYRLPSGQLYIPSNQFRSSILNASLGLRIGKTAARQIFAASLFVTDAYCPLEDPDTLEPLMEYTINSQRCVVQNQGIIRSRPLLPAWACRVAFELEETTLSETTVLEVFSTAGKICGIGDYRPKCPKGNGGPFGRYEVERL